MDEITQTKGAKDPRIAFEQDFDEEPVMLSEEEEEEEEER
jgi:hypothetical protein